MGTDLKHTPAPWTAKGGYVWSNPIGSNLVANCNKLGEQEVAEADAKLIAAAPELLEALQHAETEMRYAGWAAFDSENVARKSTYDQILIAIAKATGKELAT